MGKRKSKRMGRPKTPLAEYLGHNIVFRVTTAERRRLRAEAKKRGVKPSVLIRDALTRELGD